MTVSSNRAIPEYALTRASGASLGCLISTQVISLCIEMGRMGASCERGLYSINRPVERPWNSKDRNPVLDPRPFLRPVPYRRVVEVGVFIPGPRLLNRQGRSLIRRFTYLASQRDQKPQDCPAQKISPHFGAPTSTLVITQNDSIQSTATTIAGCVLMEMTF